MAVELLFEIANTRLELQLFFFEQTLTFQGLLMHALVESGLTPGLELSSKTRTNRAWAQRHRGRGARQGGQTRSSGSPRGIFSPELLQFSQGDALGRTAEDGGYFVL